MRQTCPLLLRSPEAAPRNDDNTSSPKFALEDYQDLTKDLTSTLNRQRRALPWESCYSSSWHCCCAAVAVVEEVEDTVEEAVAVVSGTLSLACAFGKCAAIETVEHSTTLT